MGGALQLDFGLIWASLPPGKTSSYAQECLPGTPPRMAAAVNPGAAFGVPGHGLGADINGVVWQFGAPCAARFLPEETPPGQGKTGVPAHLRHGVVAPTGRGKTGVPAHLRHGLRAWAEPRPYLGGRRGQSASRAPAPSPWRACPPPSPGLTAAAMPWEGLSSLILGRFGPPCRPGKPPLMLRNASRGPLLAWPLLSTQVQLSGSGGHGLGADINGVVWQFGAPWPQVSAGGAAALMLRTRHG